MLPPVPPRSRVYSRPHARRREAPQSPSRPPLLIALKSFWYASPVTDPDLTLDQSFGATGTKADVAAVQDGDHAAFQRLWIRCRPALEIVISGKFRRSLECALRNRLDAEVEDILQDTALLAWSKFGQFEYRGPGSLL